jgi:S-phase kinase-associated protein 1
MIKIETSDGVKFELEENVIFQSNLIRNMVANLDGGDQCIPLSSVNSEIFKKVIEYTTHHKNEPIITSHDMDREDSVLDWDKISDWDKEFLKYDDTFDELQEIMKAANTLEMYNLLDLSVKVHAHMIKGKSADEIAEIFGIAEEVKQNQAEEDEKERIRMEEFEKKDTIRIAKLKEERARQKRERESAKAEADKIKVEKEVDEVSEDINNIDVSANVDVSADIEIE